MLGFEFDDNVIPYSVYNMVQSCSCVLFQIIESQYVFSHDQFISYTFFVSLVAIVACGLTFFFDFREPTSVERKHHELEEEEDETEDELLLDIQ